MNQQWRSSLARYPFSRNTEFNVILNVAQSTNNQLMFRKESTENTGKVECNRMKVPCSLTVSVGP